MKRARADGGGLAAGGGGGGRYSAAQRRAIRASMKERQEFPYSQFGRMHVLRGSPSSLETFGPTARSANAEQKQRRQAYGFTGRGLYTGHGAYGKVNRYKKAMKWTGFAEDLVNRGMGLASVMSGQGAYTTNSLVGAGVAPEVPQFVGAGDETGSILVSRKEYLCDVYGPTSSFNVQSYSINPGLESTFPWLSQIAQNYDEYDIKQLIFTFRSTTTDIGTTSNGQCGTVIMCTNYNAAAGPFQDKIVMMEYDGAMSCKTTESMLHGVECDPAKLSGSDGKYVRSSPVVTGQDLKTYDHGLFQLAVANSPSGFENQTIGELWISYTVALRKPKFFTARGLGISQDIFVSGTGTLTTNRLLGSQDGLLTGQQNNIGCAVSLATNNKIIITIPASYAGNLSFRFYFEGLTTSGASGSIAIAGNIAYLKDMYGSAVDTLTTGPSWNVTNMNVGTLANEQGIFIAHFRVTPATDGVDNVVTFTSSAITSPGPQGSLTISEINSGFSFKAQNIGPVATQSDAPILVNASGTIVVP